jgi:hypothetical protein
MPARQRSRTPVRGNPLGVITPFESDASRTISAAISNTIGAGCRDRHWMVLTKNDVARTPAEDMRMHVRPGQTLDGRSRSPRTTYEDYVGLRGLKKHGKKKWRRYVAEVVGLLAAALVGGFRMWEKPKQTVKINLGTKGAE